MTLRTTIPGSCGQILIVALIAVMGGIAGTLITRTFIAPHPAPPEIVTLDLDALVRAGIARAATGEGSDEDKTRDVAAFAAGLTGLMREIAHERHLLILPAQAVVAGARDITGDIEKGLER